MYWWRKKSQPNLRNFGDEMSAEIILDLWGRRCVRATPRRCEIAGAGSIIEILQKNSHGNHINVWGSGFIREGAAAADNNLHFYAVRGPHSLDRLMANKKTAVGDPGLLASLVYTPSEKPMHRVGIVVHYADKNQSMLQKICESDNCIIIDPLDTPSEVVKLITSCELVLSSSLHGLIVADSFKIPNYWIKLTDNLRGGSYKFQDYYASTRRKLVPQDITIIGSDSEIDKLIRQYAPVSDLKTLQRKLIQSFPYQQSFVKTPFKVFMTQLSKLFARH